MKSLLKVMPKHLILIEVWTLIREVKHPKVDLLVFWISVLLHNMSVLELQSMNFQDFLVETRIYDCLNVSVMFFFIFLSNAVLLLCQVELESVFYPQ